MLSVLIVEDDYLFAKQLGKMLSYHDCKVLEIALNAAEGLHLFKAEKPDVVLIDIELDSSRRGMDGIAFAQEICNQKPVPFLYISAHFGAGNSYYRRAQTTPYAGYLPKDIVDTAQAWNLIQTALEKWIIDQNQLQESELPWYPFKHFLFIKKQDYNDYVSVPFHDIACLIYEAPYTYLFSPLQSFKLRIPITRLVEQLAAPYILQTEQGYAVNLSFIREYESAESLIILNRKGFKPEIINGIRDLIVRKGHSGIKVSERLKGRLLQAMNTMK